MPPDGPPHERPQPDPDSPPTLDGSRQLGPYKLLSVLGEGGMGVVYLAEQTTPLRRRVAIKVLRMGMETPEALARFESERQALAVMDHPGIAKVFDSGVSSNGRPYFVMEVVRGTPITDYADTHRLGTKDRVRLFIEVCAAVQHAHQKGVIHRDLKPSNVLVEVGDSGPRVRIIDFGIAKAAGMDLTDRTLVTRAGQTVGTPAYMSPEQAETPGLDVDTRTDIYSLGVMLYELLVGTLPIDFSGRHGHSLSHALREREVPRPSARLASLGSTLDTIARHRGTAPPALRRELAGDLDWIVLRAMEKDRTRRYETANGLALDLRRHLGSEPVRARPPSLGYRAGKFVQRHRPAVFAAGIAALAVVGGGAAATVGFVQARAEQERAERSAATAEQVSDFLVDLFSVSDPGEARGNSITAREVLDRGTERIEAELAGQPAVQVRLMRVMGDVHRGLGLYGPAIELLERAVSLGDGSDAVDQAELGQALERLGILYRLQGRTDEAIAALDRARQLSRAGDASPTPEFAVAARGLASVHIAAGRFDQAEPLLREALEIQERLLGPEHLQVAITLGALGAMYLHMRAPDQAEPHVTASLEIRERVLGPDHPEVAQTWSNLGTVRYMQGDHAGMAEAYGRANEIQERLFGDEDHPDRASVLNNLGEAVWALGRLDEARELLERALAMKERVYGPDHVSLGSTLRSLANVHRDAGRPAQAEPLYRRSLELYEAALEPTSPNIQELLQDFARMLRAADRPGEAGRLEERVAEIESARAGR